MVFCISFSAATHKTPLASTPSVIQLHPRRQTAHTKPSRLLNYRQILWSVMQLNLSRFFHGCVCVGSVTQTNALFFAMRSVRQPLFGCMASGNETTNMPFILSDSLCLQFGFTRVPPDGRESSKFRYPNKPIGREYGHLCLFVHT